MKKLSEIQELVDKKALAGAVGVMLLSWAALPIVYWLIVQKKEAKKKDGQ